MHAGRTEDQSEVIAFLGSPAAYSFRPRLVDRIETHGAIVFLAGSDAYKIKRAVRFAYMDFSTLDRRHNAVTREIAINRRFAPDIYLGALPITRERDGSLQIDGDGPPVEWAVHMRRFEQNALLSSIVSNHGLTAQIAVKLADRIHATHDRVPVIKQADADARVGATISSVASQLARMDSAAFVGKHTAFAESAALQLDRCRDCLRRRGQRGFVRHCHGDLHLNNIVLWQGMPTPFDTLEFDDDLATIDTLYDLAFLLMDLEHRKERALANSVFNRYLWRAAAGLEIEGLVALPLFLGLRAGVRAMVCAQRADQQPAGNRGSEIESARAYLSDSLNYLSPRPPRLIAVGGLSGTGKSTLAAALAPRLDPAPGALHIRTDLERKTLLEADEMQRLPEAAYAVDITEHVYDRVYEKARVTLLAGHSVIVDAVFSKRDERAAIEAVARAAGAPFDGVWLTAPRQTLLERVAARTNDPSDATVDVVKRQLQSDLGDIKWHRIDAGGSREATYCSAAATLIGS
jgi:uncharacterized protein